MVAAMIDDSWLRVQRNRLLCVMWVIRPCIHLEIREHPAAQLIFGQHPPHRILHHHSGAALQQRGVALRLEASRIAAVAELHFLFSLVPREHDLRRVGDDDEVPAEDVRRVIRPMLAHQDGGDPGGDPAEDLPLGVHVPPRGRDICGFGEVRLARHGGGRESTTLIL